MNLSNKHALEAANRRLNHAVKLSFPAVQTALSTGFGIASATTSGVTQGVMAGASALFAVLAAKSVYDDAWFWKPAVTSWVQTHRNVKESEATAKVQTPLVERAPE